MMAWDYTHTHMNEYRFFFKCKLNKVCNLVNGKVPNQVPAFDTELKLCKMSTLAEAE